MKENKIGKNIKTLRQLNGFTQRQIAEYLDIDRSLLAKIETGDRKCKIGVSKLEKLCNLFGCSLSELDGSKDFAPTVIVSSNSKDFTTEDLNAVSKIMLISSNLKNMKEISKQ